MSLEMDDEILALCAVAAGCAALKLLEGMHAGHAELVEHSARMRTCWWDTCAKNMTAYDVHLRWGVWPSAIQRVLELAEVPSIKLQATWTWGQLAGLNCVKHVCHALEYLVHGM